MAKIMPFQQKVQHFPVDYIPEPRYLPRRSLAGSGARREGKPVTLRAATQSTPGLLIC